MSLTFSEIFCWCLVRDKVSTCVLKVNEVYFKVTWCHEYTKSCLELYVF